MSPGARVLRLGRDPMADGLLPPARAAAAVGLLGALMAFLAVLALAVALAAGRLAASWQGELSEAATLQIVPPADGAIEEQARAALEVLRTTPGVRSVRMIDLAEQERLLAPWLGPDVPIESLPVPLMVEVETDRSLLDAAALVARLAAEAPAAVYDDHAAWRAPLVETAGRLRLFALGCIGLLAAGLAAAVALAARGAVAANGPAIATLRLVGARDGLIRDAVTREGRLAALAGAAIGTLAGLALVALLPRGSEPGFFLVGIGPVGWQWLWPPLVLPAAAAIAWATSALAAHRGLARWS